MFSGGRQSRTGGCRPLSLPARISYNDRTTSSDPMHATHQPTAPATHPPLGVFCPQCGSRRLLSEIVLSDPTATVRRRCCATCGHRVLTSEQLDRPQGGPLACPYCPHRRLVSQKAIHKPDKLVRIRRCPKCKAKTRTVERMMDAHPHQPRRPQHFQSRVIPHFARI